jgi:hypothetical protein
MNDRTAPHLKGAARWCGTRPAIDPETKTIAGSGVPIPAAAFRNGPTTRERVQAERIVAGMTTRTNALCEKGEKSLNH